MADFDKDIQARLEAYDKAYNKFVYLEQSYEKQLEQLNADFAWALSKTGNSSDALRLYEMLQEEKAKAQRAREKAEEKRLEKEEKPCRRWFAVLAAILFGLAVGLAHVLL